MEFLGFLLAFVGFFGFIIFLIIFIIMAILKKQKAPFAITMGCCFASLIVGLFLFGKSSSTTNLNDNSPKSNENVLNLQGEWKQKNSGSKETYHGVYINGDTIEIYWVNKESETISLYWAGTFEQPESLTKSFTWESKNDTSKTDMALLASSDETKTFQYKNGVISYSASAFGTTTTVKLEREDWGYSEYNHPSQSIDSPKNDGRIEGDGKIGNFYVEISETPQVTTDRGGNPVIIVSFDWTNNSSETTSAMVSITEKAFQDGIELDSVYQSSLYDSSNYSKDVRPGTTITIQKAYSLNNESSIVEFEISNWLSWDDDTIIYRDFNIAK